MRYKNFMLFSHCILCKGAIRATIIDLQRNKYHIIPLSLHDLFEKSTLYIEQLRATYDSAEDLETIKEYVLFLSEKELGFWAKDDEVELFPPMNTEWDFPAVISNCIISLGVVNETNLPQILEQLEELGCRYLQLRSYEALTISELKNIVALLSSSHLKSFDLLVCNDAADNHFADSIIDMSREYKKLRLAVIHTYTVSKLLNPENKGSEIVLATTEKLTSDAHCGQIHSGYFSINIQTYTEGLKFNTCLNRKISIDQDGNIKNCPSMHQHYGNVADSTLMSAVEHAGFADLWSIVKDQVQVCSDCEFRLICTDCRAYLENPADRFSKPLKCGYDPFTSDWQSWSSNPLKHQTIHYYGLASAPNS